MCSGGVLKLRIKLRSYVGVLNLEITLKVKVGVYKLLV